MRRRALSGQQDKASCVVGENLPRSPLVRISSGGAYPSSAVVRAQGSKVKEQEIPPSFVFNADTPL
eukprot:10431103-Prorocentrum_lima.AAC.1